MQRVDVVELERSILRVAAACSPVNHQALSNPKLHVTIGDGREILLTTKQHYDLIVSEPSNPYRAGVAGLFTREFYQSIEHRLNAGGMFLQWMQTYDVDDRTIEIFYRTLGSVFPNVESWQTEEGDLLLVASREPVRYDAAELRRRLSSEPLRTAMHGAWHADGLEDFLAHYVANARVATEMENLQPWPLNTDDRTVIEFAFARCISATNVFHLPNLRAAAHAADCDRPKIDDSAVDWQRVREAQISSYMMTGTAPTSISAEQRNRSAAFVEYSNGNLPAALARWRAQSAEPRTLAQLLMVAECLAGIGDASATKYIDKLAELVPNDAEAIRAELLLQQGKPAEAANALANFLRVAHVDAWPDEDLIRRSLGRCEIIAKAMPSNETAQTFYDILSTPLAVYNCDADRLARQITLGMQLDDSRPGKYTAAPLAAFEPNIFWQRTFLQIRRACYVNTKNERAESAARDLDEFVTQEAFTADTSALAKLFKGAASKGYATEVAHKAER
jgi:hypothetical protein